MFQQEDSEPYESGWAFHGDSGARVWLPNNVPHMKLTEDCPEKFSNSPAESTDSAEEILADSPDSPEEFPEDCPCSANDFSCTILDLRMDQHSSSNSPISGVTPHVLTKSESEPSTPPPLGNSNLRNILPSSHVTDPIGDEIHGLKLDASSSINLEFVAWLSSTIAEYNIATGAQVGETDLSPEIRYQLTLKWFERKRSTYHADVEMLCEQQCPKFHSIFILILIRSSQQSSWPHHPKLNFKRKLKNSQTNGLVHGIHPERFNTLKSCASHEK